MMKPPKPTRSSSNHPSIRIVSIRCVPAKDWEHRLNRAIAMLIGDSSDSNGVVVHEENGKVRTNGGVNVNILENNVGGRNNDGDTSHDGESSPRGEEGVLP